MKAIILAAGKGTRLKKLTKNKPKALVEVCGKTMLEIVIQKLKNYGIHKIMINVHHHGKMITNFLQQKNNFDLNINISDETDELLNTGGAILKMKDFINGNEPILIHNVDIISDVNINQLAEFHKHNQCIASLCTRNRNTNRGLLFNNKNELCGWTNSETNDFKWVTEPCKNYHKRAFNGIYLISPEFTDKIPFYGSFSIIDAWLKMAENHKILCFHDNSKNWFDLGTDSKIKEYENQKCN